MATATSPVVSTLFHGTLTTKKPSPYLPKPLRLHSHTTILFRFPFISLLRPSLLPNSRRPPTNTPTCFLKFGTIKISPSSALDSLVILFTSAALSSALFFADVDPAAAFVVTTPRKLQTDELATVRLFQENTPSVVNITNLAVRQDAFTLDVLEVPQGSGSGFVWDKLGHIVTNYHVIRGASDIRLPNYESNQHHLNLALNYRFCFLKIGSTDPGLICVALSF